MPKEVDNEYAEYAEFDGIRWVKYHGNGFWVSVSKPRVVRCMCRIDAGFNLIYSESGEYSLTSECRNCKDRDIVYDG